MSDDLITVIYCLSYVANILVSRYLNMFACKLSSNVPRLGFIWFIPLFGPLLMLIVALKEYFEKGTFKIPWFDAFFGKNW